MNTQTLRTLGSAVVLSLDRMTRVRAVDPLDNPLTAEAGVTLAEIQATAEGAGRRFTLTHGGEGSSAIGGNLFGRNALYRAVGSNRHERGRLHSAATKT